MVVILFVRKMLGKLVQLQKNVIQKAILILNSNSSSKKLNPWLIVILPVLLIIIGATVHYLRGSYTVGSPNVKYWGVDDAYITYRYSWNLTHFQTLSWNESGFRRTEGFTNPLWVMIGIAWSLLNNKDLVYPLSVLTSILFTSILFALLILAVIKRHEWMVVSSLGLCAVALLPSIWLHTTSGLESSVFGVGLALLAYLVLFPKENTINPKLIIFLSIFLGLLRSDGFIYLTIILFAAIIAGSKDWKPLLFGLFIASAVLFSWRYLTFGTLVPNTAIAKINFHLFDRLQIGSLVLSATVFYSGLLIFLSIGLAGLWSEGIRSFFGGLFIVTAWISYYLYIGGDGYFERHLIGLYFLMAAVSAPLWIEANRRSRAFLFVVIIISCFICVYMYKGRFNYLTPKSQDPWIMLGKAVEGDRERYGVLITFAAGKIPFFAGGNNIDMLGLNDPLLATLQQDRFVPGHSSGDAQAAIKIASSATQGRYSTFSYLDPFFIKDPEDISIWISNVLPSESVQYDVTAEQWDAALSTGNMFIWSIISEPVRPEISEN